MALARMKKTTNVAKKRQPPPLKEKEPKRARVEIEYEAALAPPNWKEVYERIQKMRKETVAPVDTMGCASFRQNIITPAESRYHILISLILSAQTKDAVTAAAMNSLRNHGLTVDNIINTSESTIDSLISKVGFHARKAGYIKRTSQILKDKFNSDIPSELSDILSLPGVGKKMAYLLLTHAWDNTQGIGVDVHVHRISNRLGWVHNTKTPEQTRVGLEAWMPKEYWGKDGVNKMLVGFGQTICKPIGPKCGICAVNDLCPSAFKETKQGKKEQQEKETTRKVKREATKKEIKKETKKRKRIKKESGSSDSDSDSDYM